MKTKIMQFLREEDGVTALEYGILAAVVALIIAGVFDTQLKNTFTTLFGNVTTAVSTASGT